MGLIVAVVAVGLAAVAAAGVMVPFRKGGSPALERLSDQLEDERTTLLRSLRDLDEERAAGALGEEDYRSLRQDTEARAATVLRALAARDATPGLAVGLRELRSGSGNGQQQSHRPARRRSALPVFLVAAAVLAVSVPLLAGAIRDRGAGQPITGTDVTGQASLSFFEQRVREHPGDVAARLDLAERYRQSGDLQGATAQYLAALRLNPRNAEANANVGYLLYLSGDAEGGLGYANRSLRADADYPEGLYVKGVILARGLRRHGPAADALRAYLAAAPYGSHRAEVLRLLRRR